MGLRSFTLCFGIANNADFENTRFYGWFEAISLPIGIVFNIGSCWLFARADFGGLERIYCDDQGHLWSFWGTQILFMLLNKKSGRGRIGYIPAGSDVSCRYDKLFASSEDGVLEIAYDPTNGFDYFGVDGRRSKLTVVL
ncbi:hypothetical protein HB779_20290 [Phyllobacterium sp. 628]|uniref:hypothetical protein n=1 Tax=Phyllobacterium sp. 628 TaxID=2718938 RepID=UPI00166247AE|nr:hypothetical protein [Phyllobacterium sp. 628]QND53970.1 hypothetical protein HB779_20290 [Phyllobacterium sp. 628]